NRGAIVRRVTAQDIHEICQVRRALECEAVRSATGRADRDALRLLADELRSLACARPADSRWIRIARAADDRLHDLIAASCGNAFLAAELGRLTFLFRAFRDMAWEHVETHDDFHRVAEE